MQRTTKRPSFQGLVLIVAAAVCAPVLVPLDDTRGRRARASATINVGDRVSVIAAYEAEFHKWAIDPEWTGNVASCTPGTTSVAWRAATLSRVNYYRAMAGVPSVTHDGTLSDKAAYAAVMMSSKGELSHYPDRSWPCYDSGGIAATAAGTSNLALGSTGPAAVDQYIVDPGSNNAAVGHRSWLLHPQLKPVGTGDAISPRAANALWVDLNYSLPHTPRDAGIAWPTPGYFPDVLVPPRWSYHRRGASFTDATVTVTGPNGPVNVEIEHRTGWLDPGLTFLPDVSDSVTSDTTYRVRIAGSGLPGGAISYDVTLVDVNAAPRIRIPWQYRAPVCSAPQTTLASVTATDENESTVQYSVVGGADADYIGVNSQGQAIVAKPLDPTRLSYNVVIQATDEFGVTDQRAVTIEVAQIGADTLCPIRNAAASVSGSKVTVTWDQPIGGAAVTKVVAWIPSVASCNATDSMTCDLSVRRNGSHAAQMSVTYSTGAVRSAGTIQFDVTDGESASSTGTATGDSATSPTTGTGSGSSRRTQTGTSPGAGEDIDVVDEKEKASQRRVPKGTPVVAGSVTSMKKLVKLPAGKRTYQLTGGCVLNAKKTAVIAPKKKATCRLTVTDKVGKKTTKVQATLRVS